MIVTLRCVPPWLGACLAAASLALMACRARDTPRENIAAAQQRLLAAASASASKTVLTQMPTSPPAECFAPDGAATYLVITPDPIIACGTAPGIARVCWRSTSTHAEIHLGSPTGLLFAAGQSGSQVTGKWVSDGMKFFLQDRADAAPLDNAHTVAIQIAHVKHVDCSTR